MSDALILTLDMDWAPDWMLEEAAALIEERGVRCTWFATHDSPAVRAIARNPLFEIGLHPNFLPGSTQGSTPEEIMDRLRALFPEARASRSHSLHQNERLLQMLCERYGVRVDCSLYLPGCPGQGLHRLRYSEGGPELLRVPHVFQDNMHLAGRFPFSRERLFADAPGIKVVNFHPIHIALNTTSLADYYALCASHPVCAIARDQVPALRNADQRGIRDLFLDALDIAAGQTRQWTIGDLDDAGSEAALG